MPNRYVRADAIKSKIVDRLSAEAEVFWRRLLNVVDDFGRYEGDPALLLAACYPLRVGRMTLDEVNGLIQECISCGVFALYTVDDEAFIQIAKWEKGRAKESKYPPPDEATRERLQTYVYTREHLHADENKSPDSDTDSENNPLTPLAGEVEFLAKEIEEATGPLVAAYQRRLENWTAKECQQASKLIRSGQITFDRAERYRRYHASTIGNKSGARARAKLSTALNTWPGELDKLRAWEQSKGIVNGSKKTADPKPEFDQLAALEAAKKKS